MSTSKSNSRRERASATPPAGVAWRPTAPPLHSAKALWLYLDIQLKRSRHERRLLDRPDADRHAEDSAEDDLAPAWAHYRWLRERAYPGDGLDLNSFSRAIGHRSAMPHARADEEALLPADTAFWTFVGPKNLKSGADSVSGRANAVAFDPVDPMILYAGAAGGGAWKSYDGGDNWVPLSNNWPFEAVSSIAIDPSNPQTVYVGTGDFHAWSNQSFGLMKSTDGGASFTNLAVAECGDTSISAILIDPESPNVVIMTSGRGRQRYGNIWRSEDGGASWKKVGPADGEWADVRAGDLDAATGKRWYYAVGWNASGGLMYRSGDRGQSWAPVSPPWGAGQWGIAVAPSPNFPQNVYVLAGADMKVFGSTTAGDNWQDITGDLSQNQWDWNQLWYDWYLRCSALVKNHVATADILYLGLKHIFRSLGDGQWSVIGSGHDDQHDLAVDPNDPNRCLLANDGGVWLAVADPSQVEWAKISSLNGTLGIAQLYRGAFSRTNLAVMQGAAQDNGTDAATGDLNQWKVAGLARSGDSVAAVISPANDMVQFAAIGVGYYGNFRTDDQWASNTEITPAPQGDRIPDSTTLAMDGAGERLFWGTNFLWVWDELSQSWTAHVGNQVLSGTDIVRAIAAAPSDPKRLYTGSGDGELWMADANWAWTRINGGSPSLPNRSITAISVNPSDPDDIVVTLSGSGAAHVWRCADVTASSRTWSSVSGSGSGALPDLPANGIVRDPNDPATVWYVGTDLGVFFTADAGGSWQDMTIPYGLPSVPVKDLVATPTHLHAVTFGRGIWRAPFRWWSAPVDLGGVQLKSAPAAVSRNSSRIDVFYQGPNNHLWTSWWDGGPWWSAPADLGGVQLKSAPAAVSRNSSRIDVFYQGPNNHLWTSWWDGGPWWSAPADLGGVQLKSAPAAVSRNPNRIDVFYRGPNDHLWTSWWDGGPWWSAPVDLGGVQLKSAPTAVCRSPSRIDVFYRGPNNHLWTSWWDGGPWWSAPADLGGTALATGPGAVARGSNRIEVFYGGADQRLWTSWWAGGPWWSPPYDLGGAVITSEVSGVSRLPTRIDLFFRGPNGDLWTRWR